MSNRGPYDIALQNYEESLVHGSHREKDYDIAVTDGVQDTKVETEIDKQKQIIKGTSSRDLRNYSFE
jgi:hypothetical protein